MSVMIPHVKVSIVISVLSVASNPCVIDLYPYCTRLDRRTLPLHFMCSHRSPCSPCIRSRILCISRQCHEEMRTFTVTVLRTL
jgi:hypothetical protein